MSNILLAAPSSIMSRSHIFKFTNLSKSIFIMVDLLKYTRIYFISLLLVLVIVGLITNAEINKSIILFPFYFINLFISLYCISVTLAYLTPYLRDIKFLLEALMPAFMWLTPIMYPINALNEKIALVLSYSPFTIAMKPFTSIIYHGIAPSTDDNIKLLVMTIVLFVIALIVYRKMAKNIVYYL